MQFRRYSDFLINIKKICYVRLADKKLHVSFDGSGSNLYISFDTKEKAEQELAYIEKAIDNYVDESIKKQPEQTSVENSV